MTLSEYYGALDEATAEELDRIVQERRARLSDSYRENVAAIVDAIEETTG